MLRKLANYLTYFRLIAGLPVIFALSKGYESLAWLLIFLAGLSDFADGYLARKAGGGTVLGARLDPLADKILLSAPLLWLNMKEVIPLWAIWLLVSRELLITIWRSSEKEGGQASLGGKAKTLLQFASILLMIWPSNWGNGRLIGIIHKIGWYLFWPSLVLALTTAMKYLNYPLKHRRS
ncbi:CDP-alcohol phosphatidyltransferase family protein [Prochlorococcus sp. MIT 1307]|uniref:CDP-alcohol phosphatidyltransferase family protein n=1 Tax=Prochlorococcus sp. MIT 1307 TaxID=3096219 RepID=UPI002A756EFB|nr:CDP-alcohol phosphatidyltransferase family protein [Prochlorococcus sp. MIT 1307]